MCEHLIKYYEQEKKKAVEECTTCGDCVRACPAIAQIGSLRNIAPGDIQRSIIEFLGTGIPDQTAFERAFSCVQCWTCTEGICPVGLDPQMINETVKWEYRRYGIHEHHYPDPQEPLSSQRIIARLLSSESEFERLITPRKALGARYLFFPGCNVYWQPDKLLNALDILDRIDPDYGYLPGMDYCCGNIHLTYGAIEKADRAMMELTAKLNSFQTETVVFWCPNCYMRFVKTLPHIQQSALRFMTFTQFVCENLERLSFPRSIPETITLHEICKLGILRLEINEPRRILTAVPGIELVEMPRHGENTVCCGCMLADYFPDTFQRWRTGRLKEAEQTGAGMLVDICHACHETFVDQEVRYNYRVVNLATVIAEALGTHREDRFKKYKQWGDPSRILSDVKESMDKLPYEHDIIVGAVEKVFARR